MKKSAFTLIELLVVISIIAILAGIALPVFSRVMERSKVTSDGNNLRQLGIGLFAYLNDNDDAMFPVSAAGPQAWPTALHEKYVTNWKTFLSPFDKRPVQEGGGNTPVSFGINVNCLGVNASKYKSPSQLIMMAPIPTNPGGTELIFSETSAGNPQLPMPSGGTKAGTHNNRSQINALFGDIHVENMQYRKFSDSGSEEGKKAWYPEPQ